VNETLRMKHAACVERWHILRAEMRSINYTFDGVVTEDKQGLGIWAAAKEIQFNVIIEQPITPASVARLDELLKETHCTMFFDAIAIGAAPAHTKRFTK